MKNILAGLLWGLVALVGGLGAVSYLVPARVEVAPPSPAEPLLDPAPAAAPSAAAPAPAPTETAPTETAPTETTPPAPARVAPDPAVTPEPSAAPAKEPSEEPEPETGAKTLAPPEKGADLLPDSPPAADDAAPKPVAEPAPDITLPPLQAFAGTFDDLGGKPLFGIILQDTGGADIDRDGLAALPFPVTIALDPTAEGASAAMATYRAAGKEVVILASALPDGASAQDIEQNLQAFATTLPETTALMAPPSGGFQASREAAQMIVPALAAQGRGLLTFDQGLNAADQIAQREALPHGLIFRQIDGQGESVPVIRRYLDRAVFKAAQEGSAIVMGTTAPDTIAALLEWSLEGRASEVALVPASTLLK